MSAKESTPSPPSLTPVGEGWSFTRSAPAEVLAEKRPTRSAASSNERNVLDEIISAGEFEVLERGDFESRPGRRGAETAVGSSLRLTADVPEGAAVLLMVRQESGAISFHRPGVAAHRRGPGVTNRVSFEVPLSSGDPGTGRRGWFSKIVRVVLVKVADALIGDLVEHASEWLVPKLAGVLEKKLWQNRTQGWLRVDPTDLAAAEDRMKKGLPSFSSPQRGLLLIHGTFSSCHGGFRELAKGRFFQDARALYGGNIYAFNHFTISKTPQENVKDLLDALPEGEFEFDIITHSRGGLVARELLEGSGLDHPKRRRLKIARVILVASPSAGTPLAGESHWESKLSLWANLIELLPDNPFVTAAGFLTEALQWVAANVLGNCSGLIAMDPAGSFITRLQDPPDEPPGTRYHVITSNFEPPRGWLPRLGDMALDRFFGEANDLVVPSEGSWKNSDVPAAWVPGERIACFGPGGNVPSDIAVHHVNYFSHPATVDFLLATLGGRETGLKPIDVTAHLPSGGFRFSRALVPAGGAAPRMPGDTAGPDFVPAEVFKTAVKEAIRENSVISINGWDEEDTLYLTIISSGHDQVFDKEKGSSALLLAQYGSARVAQPLYTNNVKAKPANSADWTNTERNLAGTRIAEIIAMQKFMVGHTNGKRQAPLKTTDDGIEYTFKSPDAKFLRLLGKRLFRVLITGQVVRLYDSVTHRHRRERVNIIFTSMLPWLSDLPWEFLYDPDMECHVSTSNVRFLRNVLTPIPANKIDRVRKKLRILVASAQAYGASHISHEQETQRIRESFRDLLDLGLVEVDVINRCTPDALHTLLRCGEENSEYDVLHFIGHGYYDEQEGGYLEFVDDNLESQPLTAGEFTRIIRSRGIRIVFLNSCESGRGNANGNDGSNKKGANYNKGVAIELAKCGMPAVVANQYSVVDTLASLFSLHFYNCLAHGLSIADAVREARIAVSYSDEAEPMDWGVPVLFARNPNATLCARRPYDPGLARRVLERKTAPTTRRGSANELLIRRDKRVVIWTSSATLLDQEQLRATLAEMTACQTSFEFVLKRRRIPASIWKIEDRTGYLDAHSILEPVDEVRKNVFKAQFLIFITDFPMMMMKENVEALYYYSSEERHFATMLFSIWGFDPPLGGEAFKAALANHAATALLDCFAKTPPTCETRGGAESSPGFMDYFNDERSVEHISGPMFIPPGVDGFVRGQIGAGQYSDKEYESIKLLLKLYHSGHDPCRLS